MTLDGLAPGAKYAAAAAEAAGLAAQSPSSSRGGRSPGRARAQHKMAVARLRLALQADSPDKKTVLAVMESLVVERSKLESAIAKAHIRHMNERAEAQISELRKETDAARQAARHAQQRSQDHHHHHQQHSSDLTFPHYHGSTVWGGNKHKHKYSNN